MLVYLARFVINDRKMTDIPAHHLGHALVYSVTSCRYDKVRAHGSDLLHGRRLALFPKQSDLRK